MNIIIEGPDWKAKELITKMLSGHLDLSVTKLEDVEAVKNKDFYLELLDTKNHIFHDFYLTEYIYRTVRKQPPNLSLDEMKEIETKIKEKNYIVLYLTNNEKQLVKNKCTNIESSYFLSDVEVDQSKKHYDFLFENLAHGIKIEMDPEIWRFL